MNKKIFNLVQNFSLTLISNLITLIISAFITFLFPKLIGIEEYSFLQLYLFYILYVGFLHFGWVDGIYLKYGGKNYTELDKKIFFSQIWMLILLQVILFLLINFIFNHIAIYDTNKAFIIRMSAYCMLFLNIRFMLLYILQATNRIKENANILILDRINFLCLIIIILFNELTNYKIIIIADVISKLLSLFLAIYYCKDLIFQKPKNFYLNYKETIENINIGIKLMLANIASLLIIGVIRFNIEFLWGISVFGKVSLTLSIANLLMVFTNSIALVIFPILKRVSENKLPKIYNVIRDFLMIILLGILLIYYPLRLFLFVWLPNYTDSLKYITILFPICIFEGKMSLLINTYLKALRKEKQILIINFITFGFSVLCTIIIIIIKKLDIAILSIIILLAFRSIIAELYLSKKLDISVSKDIIYELVLTIIFIFLGWYINSWITTILYGIAYILYLYIKRNDIKNGIQTIKNFN